MSEWKDYILNYKVHDMHLFAASYTLLHVLMVQSDVCLLLFHFYVAYGQYQLFHSRMYGVWIIFQYYIFVTLTLFH